MERLSAEWIERELASARHCGELRAWRDRLAEAFPKHLLAADPLGWNRRLNRVHDALIRRAVELAERAMKEEGSGTAPLPYAFVLYGSGGRGEQTMWSDQDNGLIYADPPDEEMEERAKRYFEALAEKIGANLLQAGYPPCSGGVICTNVNWRKTLSEYKAMLREWLDDPAWENVRYLLIAADMRTVYGNAEIGAAALDDLFERVAADPAMLKYMLHNTLYHKVSLGVFGQLIKERYGEDAGGVDVKYGAYIPIVNGLRLLALEAGVRFTSTEERIAALVRAGKVDEEIGADWEESLSIALKLRNETPYQEQEGYYTTRGKLTAEQLTKERVRELKLCLRIGIDLQKYVKKAVLKE